MTLRKTLIGALAALLLFAGFSSRAQAQETDTTTDTTTSDTTTDTTDTTTTDTDTTTTDTTTTDTDTDTTSTDTTTADTDTATADGTTTGTDGAAAGTVPVPEADTSVAQAFGTETPNPQPGQPLTTADDAAANPAAADPEPAVVEAVAAQEQLAFTGPDVRVMALGFLLLGAGTLFAVVSHRQKARFAMAEAWFE